MRGTSFTCLDTNTLTKHPNSLLIESSNSNLIVLECDEFLDKVVPLSIIGDVPVRPRGVAIAKESISDDVAMDATILLLGSGRLPLYHDGCGRTS